MLQRQWARVLGLGMVDRSVAWVLLGAGLFGCKFEAGFRMLSGAAADVAED